jgi:hypothetical protein
MHGVAALPGTGVGRALRARRGKCELTSGLQHAYRRRPASLDRVRPCRDSSVRRVPVSPATIACRPLRSVSALVETDPSADRAAPPFTPASAQGYVGLIRVPPLPSTGQMTSMQHCDTSCAWCYCQLTKPLSDVWALMTDTNARFSNQIIDCSARLLMNLSTDP